MDFHMIVLRKNFYIHWSVGRSPRVHEVNPGRDPSKRIHILVLIADLNLSRSLVGVTELYLYGGTCRYYRAYTCAKVPVGTTKLIL